MVAALPARTQNERLNSFAISSICFSKLSTAGDGCCDAADAAGPVVAERSLLLTALE